MSIQEITSYDSPNFTRADQVPYVFGRKRVVRYIAIHWWGDPASRPTFEGTINYLCNPLIEKSAHAVVEAGRVAYLVDSRDAAWAAGHPILNAEGIQVECNPRCSTEDIEAAAEVVAIYRMIWGDIPLTRHGWWVPTQCPGNYDIDYLDRRSYEINLSKHGKRHG